MKKIIFVFLFGILFFPLTVQTAGEKCYCVDTYGEISGMNVSDPKQCTAKIQNLEITSGGKPTLGFYFCEWSNTEPKATKIDSSGEIGYLSKTCENVNLADSRIPNYCATEDQQDKYCGCLVSKISVSEAAVVMPADSDKFREECLSKCNRVPCCYIRKSNGKADTKHITESECKKEAGIQDVYFWSAVATQKECNLENFYIKAEFAIPPELAGLRGTKAKIGTVNNLIANFIKVAMGLVGSIALIMFVYGGIMWMTAAGHAEREDKALDVLLWAAIGVIVILSSYVLADFVLQAF
jgi:hypothetical protein